MLQFVLKDHSVHSRALTRHWPVSSLSISACASRGGRAFVERAMQPPNRCRVNAVSARYVDQAFAISEPLECFLTLVLLKLARAAKTHSTGLCALPTSSVRALIRCRSKVAKPARIVTSSSPCGVEVRRRDPALEAPYYETAIEGRRGHGQVFARPEGGSYTVAPHR